MDPMEPTTTPPNNIDNSNTLDPAIADTSHHASSQFDSMQATTPHNRLSVSNGVAEPASLSSHTEDDASPMISASPTVQPLKQGKDNDSMPMVDIIKKEKKQGDDSVAVDPAVLIDSELEKLIQTDPRQGLSEKEALDRLLTHGHNEIKQVKPSQLLKLLGYFIDPIAILIEVAMVFSAAIQDWIDFGIIGGLLIVNALIGFIEEAKAESAIDALQKTLSLKSKVYRDGAFKDIESSLLVPGDIVSVRIGDIVPADCKLLGLTATFTDSKEALMLDEAALTGESLPVSKHRGDTIFSSSICKQGQMMAVVTKTGEHTFIGRAATLINITQDKSHFQIIVGCIGYFLIIITCVLVLLIFIVKAGTQQRPQESNPSANLYLALLQEIVVLTVAAIPVGLPTVLSVTMAVGARELSLKNVIVKRLTAIEELSAVQILCSDKTGTLTLNNLSLDEPWLAPGFTNDNLLTYAYLSSEHIPSEPIEICIHREAETKIDLIVKKEQDRFEVLEFTPFNPDTKSTMAVVKDNSTGEIVKYAKGAPQVIIKLVGGHKDAENAVTALALRGLRALGVAISQNNDDNWEIVGMLSLLDPPRPDSKHTIEECQRLGVQVKMVTGDQILIAKEVSKRLGLFQNILDAHCLESKTIDEDELIRRCEKADGFGEVVPENKFRVVELLQKKSGRLVGMTGDGVNDAPALKKANVGIAVHGCTDAARMASDIVLMAPGLSTIVDGIKVSRAIFQRMRSYALYRISSTVHFLLFFFITIMAFNWSLPARLIILIALLNDAATLVISVDNAQLSQHPDKWRLGQLMTLSSILGLLLTVSSFILYFFAKNAMNVDNNVLVTIMYLQISSSPHFMIFGTRLAGHFWENHPSLIFIGAIMATQIFAMFISIFGISGLTTAIGWTWGVLIMVYSTIVFVCLDYVKVLVIRNWTYENTVKFFPLPSRVREFEQRVAANSAFVRAQANTIKLRKIVTAMSVVKYWQTSKGEKKASPVP